MDGADPRCYGNADKRAEFLAQLQTISAHTKCTLPNFRRYQPEALVS